jgi:hypothetical protein
VTVKVPGPKRMKLLAKVRFTRRGRLLVLRARATRTGLLRIALRKHRRALGSCRRQAFSGHRLRCRIRLPRHASPARAKLVVKLVEGGRTTAFSVLRVPRRLRRA